MQNRVPAFSIALVALLGCSACAGQDAAMLAAHRAANQVQDLQAHLGSSVTSYAEIRETQYANIAQLGVTSADIEANSNSHTVGWATAEEEDSTAMFKSLSASNADEALLKTAAFRIIEPAPLFQSPQIDNKTMAQITNRLSVLAQKPSLANRLAEFASFVIAANKEFEKVKDAGDRTASNLEAQQELRELEGKLRELEGKLGAFSGAEQRALEGKVITSLVETPSDFRFQHPIQSMLPGQRATLSETKLPTVTRLNFVLSATPASKAQPTLDTVEAQKLVQELLATKLAMRKALIRATQTPTPGWAPEPTPIRSGTVDEASIADNSEVTSRLIDGLLGVP